MKEIKALLFDFDGVLADTEPHHWRSWNQSLERFGIQIDWPTYERICIGVSDTDMLDAFRSMAPGEPPSYDELRALYPEKRQRLRDSINGTPVLDASLVERLSGLKDIAVAVVTSSNVAEVEPILQRENLLPALDTVVYGNEVQRRKPAPDPYLLAAERLGVKPEECVVFEDSNAGVAAGTAAGCRVVRVKEPAEVRGLVEQVLGGAL